MIMISFHSNKCCMWNILFFVNKNKYSFCKWDLLSLFCRIIVIDIMIYFTAPRKIVIILLTEGLGKRGQPDSWGGQPDFSMGNLIFWGVVKACDDVTIDLSIVMHACIWKVISESLDINFIHGDIHGQSCNEYIYFVFQDSSLLCDWMSHAIFHSINLRLTVGFPRSECSACSNPRHDASWFDGLQIHHRYVSWGRGDTVPSKKWLRWFS